MLSERPDVVLCEMGLYDMSGIDLCREVRADRKVSDTCVVLLAKSFHSGENVRSALNAGADDCVSEKGNLEQLVAKLTWLTQRRRVEREQALNYHLLRSRQIQIASIVKDAAKMIRSFSGSGEPFGSVAETDPSFGTETSHPCLAPELIASLASLLDEQVSVFERLDPNPRTAYTSAAGLTPNELIHFDIAM
jgi:CheY-like chemotaxis protein